MATVAGLILALIVNQANMEPKIEWIFSADACEQCAMQQVAVMARFYQPGDRVFLNFPKRDKDIAKRIEHRVRQHFPKAEMVYKNERHAEVITGWVLKDTVTGDVVSYQTRTEKYGTFVSQTMLEIFRDPRD